MPKRGLLRLRQASKGGEGEEILKICEDRFFIFLPETDDVTDQIGKSPF